MCCSLLYQVFFVPRPNMCYNLLYQSTIFWSSEGGSVVRRNTITSNQTTDLPGGYFIMIFVCVELILLAFNTHFSFLPTTELLLMIGSLAIVWQNNEKIDWTNVWKNEQIVLWKHLWTNQRQNDIELLGLFSFRHHCSQEPLPKLF